MCKLLGFCMKSVKSILGSKISQNKKLDTETCFIQSTLTRIVQDPSYLSKLASLFSEHPGENRTPTNENISRSELGTKVTSAPSGKFLRRKIWESCCVKLNQGHHVAQGFVQSLLLAFCTLNDHVNFWHFSKRSIPVSLNLRNQTQRNVWYSTPSSSKMQKKKLHYQGAKLRLFFVRESENSPDFSTHSGVPKKCPGGVVHQLSLFF